MKRPAIRQITFVAGACQGFHDDIAKLGVTLPLGASVAYPGDVHDESGATIFTVDINRDLPDEAASAIALWIATAVNVCAGYQSEVITSGVASCVNQSSQAGPTP